MFIFKKIILTKNNFLINIQREEINNQDDLDPPNTWVSWEADNKMELSMQKGLLERNTNEGKREKAGLDKGSCLRCDSLCRPSGELWRKDALQRSPMLDGNN